MAANPKLNGCKATSGIEIFTFATPNGYRPTILLEELKDAYGLKYSAQCINLGDKTHKEPWYLEICPNGKIPAIVDHDNGDFRLFESAAIMNYLCRMYDTNHMFYFVDFKDSTLADQWLFWHVGDMLPTQSYAHQFFRSLPESDAFATQKFVGEAARSYGVLNSALEGRDYLVGPNRGTYSIADIANFAFVNFSGSAGLGRDLKMWPNVERWWKAIYARPAVKRGLKTPMENPIENYTLWKKIEEDEEFKQKEEELEAHLKKGQEQYKYVYQSV
ncbi:glutathione S-transferase [Periconia macrospinosa]|uniref:Glutathione S-transferase n=1 Tax=Periconia macrospinosa TaxID=97972 RepID=A0A2V1DC47_9PLEO|nr:glutathione S-transferase [Periconia macrospinosa]